MRAAAEWIDPAQPDEQLTLDLYPGSTPSSWILYEDDGDTVAYREGAFCCTTICMAALKAQPLVIDIGPACGHHAHQACLRSWTLRLHLPQGRRITTVSVDGASTQPIMNGVVPELHLSSVPLDLPRRIAVDVA